MSNKISMIELFSGIGAQERAIRQLGLPYEIINTCDCDKDAVLSYAAMRYDIKKEMETFEFPSQDKMIEELQAKNLGYDFDKDKHTITKRTPLIKLKQYYIADKLSKNLGDISKVEKLPYADIVTYSSPCQSFSVAGKLAGATKTCTNCGHKWDIDFSNPDYNYKCPICNNTSLESTTSGLLQEVQRLLSIAYENNELPKYLLLENVKNLVGKKFIGQFEDWIKWLDSIGYNTKYQILNAKHYGIAQNRERVFALSIRKDIDTKEFKFSDQIPLKTRLKDVLENNVLEKYYLPDERIEKILNSTFMKEKQSTDTDEIKVVGNYMPSGYDASRVVDIEGIAPTVKENHGTVTAIAEPQKEPIIYDDYNSHISADQDAINTLTCNCGASAERNGVKIIEPVIVDDIYNNRDPRIYDEYSPTLRSERTGFKVAEEIEYPCSTRGKQVASTIRASIYKQGARNLEENVVNGLGYEGIIEQIESKIKWRIRKLTTKECWRLMGFSDLDHDRAAKYVSSSALYKQAGNSICTSCLISIFYSLFHKDSSSKYKRYLVKFDD